MPTDEQRRNELIAEAAKARHRERIDLAKGKYDCTFPSGTMNAVKAEVTSHFDQSMDGHQSSSCICWSSTGIANIMLS
jgi:hypothetical protein